MSTDPDEPTVQKLLIRAGRAPHLPLSNESATAWGRGGSFNFNTGNMLYSDAVFTTLNVPGAEILCDGYAPEQQSLDPDAAAALINERFDVYVLPMADIFRSTWARSMPRLTQIISRLDIPVVVTSACISNEVDPTTFATSDAIRDNAREFVAAVCDRSASFGVRGDLTAGFIRSLGFPDSVIDVVGCASLSSLPSLDVQKKTDALEADSPIAINTVRTAPWGDFYAQNASVYENMTLILQELDEVEFLLWGKEPVTRWAPGLPSTLEHPAVGAGRVQSFTQQRAWIEAMSRYEFVFGSRLHGCIAGLLAGTPAFLMTIDPRTAECADYHGIPSGDATRLLTSGKHLAQDLYERTDLAALRERMPENFNRFTSFLERNGLRHVHQAGMSNVEYDAKLAATAVSGAVVAPNATDPLALASRLRWLWQSRDADAQRPVGAHREGLAFTFAQAASPTEKAVALNHLLDQSADMATLSESLVSVVTSLQERLVDLEGRVGALNVSAGQI